MFSLQASKSGSVVPTSLPDPLTAAGEGVTARPMVPLTQAGFQPPAEKSHTARPYLGPFPLHNGFTFHQPLRGPCPIRPPWLPRSNVSPMTPPRHCAYDMQSSTFHLRLLTFTCIFTLCHLFPFQKPENYLKPLITLMFTSKEQSPLWILPLTRSGSPPIPQQPSCAPPAPASLRKPPWARLPSSPLRWSQNSRSMWVTSCRGSLCLWANALSFPLLTSLNMPVKSCIDEKAFVFIFSSFSFIQFPHEGET